MPSLISLPLELLEIIQFYLFPDDLAAFASTCQYFRGICSRGIDKHNQYRKDWTNIFKWARHLSHSRYHRSLIECLSDICNDPEKGFYPRRLVVSDEYSTTRDTALEADRLRFIASQSQIVTVEEVEPFLKVAAARRAMTGLLLGLAIELLPNLRSLHVWEHAEHFIQLVIPRILARKDYRCPPLHGLEDVTIRSEVGLRVGFENLVLFMSLPKVQKYQEDGIRVRPGVTRWPFSGRQSTLTHINIRHSMVSVGALDELFSRLIALRNFGFDILLPSSYPSIQYIMHATDVDYHPRKVIELLLKHAQDSLDTVRLKYESNGPSGVIKDFREFNSLRFIRISQQIPKRVKHSMDYGKFPPLTDFFPSSVQVIELTATTTASGWMFFQHEYLAQLLGPSLETTMSALPNLTRLSIQTTGGPSWHLWFPDVVGKDLHLGGAWSKKDAHTDAAEVYDWLRHNPADSLPKEGQPWPHHFGELAIVKLSVDAQFAQFVQNP